MEGKVKSKRMSSSRKHKKHKEKKQNIDIESNSSEQKPLRLVLKVPTPYSTQSSPNPTANTSQSAPTLEPQSEANDSESPPKLMAFSGLSPQTSQTSSKKVKKKKSKKKHRKHSHHSSHHSRHRHRSHHRRHHGSCSHHSRQSQDSNSASLSGAVLVPQKSPQKSSSSSKSCTKSQFQYFLSHLLKQLQRKDIQQFFAWPVSDMIAPGYSSIIAQPMDLSSMKRKIDQNEYESIPEFKADVKLICDNCQKYNRPETVYYKAATKLWHYTRNKLLNRDALIDVARSYPGLSSYELGFHFEEPNFATNTTETDVNHNRAPDLVSSTPMTIGETLPLIEERPELQEVEAMDEDGMTPEQILEEAKKAAKMAADRLTLERPNGAHFSFLRQRGDGSTTLSIVGNHSYEQNINLEALVGKLVEGTAALAPFKEVESNRIRPIESINESPFCSYLPSLDSSKATLNEEDSALLLSTYGDDELGQQYAQSITQFSYETDYVLNLVDSLLDILTHGQHQKIAVKLREKQKIAENQTLNASNDSNIVTNNTEIQGRLNETGSLIGQLESLQYQRLSSSTLPIKPSTEEEKLANQLSSKLTDIIGSHSAPKEVSDINCIRKAMGIKIKTEK